MNNVISIINNNKMPNKNTFPIKRCGVREKTVIPKINDNTIDIKEIIEYKFMSKIY